MQNIDLRGLNCPEPVLRTKKLLDQNVEEIAALVDDEVNVQNLKRLAASQGWHFSTTALGDHHRVHLTREARGEKQAQTEVAGVASGSGGTVIFITKDTFGHGATSSDHDFSYNLLDVFLQTVQKSGHNVRAVLIANSGVKIMDPSAPQAKVLADLRQAGVEVLGCGLCLEYYKLKDKIPVEQITSMFAICEYLFAADKVLSP